MNQTPNGTFREHQLAREIDNRSDGDLDELRVSDRHACIVEVRATPCPSQPFTVAVDQHVQSGESARLVGEVLRGLFLRHRQVRLVAEFAEAPGREATSRNTQRVSRGDVKLAENRNALLFHPYRPD